MFHVKHDGPDSIRAFLEQAVFDLAGISGEAMEQMAAHWQMVKEWNQRTNLTAISDDHDAAWLHYRDSLAALSLLPEGSLVDLGSGAGFPGIPLAIAQPNRPVTLVDSRRKRASFLALATARLGLRNVRVWTGRMEQAPAEPFGLATTRATFSRADKIVECLSWVAPGGLLVAYRSGQGPQLAAAMTHRYPLLGQQRCLEILRA